MEKEENYLLYKSRSYGACIKAGYNLFTDNFRKIFTSTWIVVLMISLLESGIGAIGFSIFEVTNPGERMSMIAGLVMVIAELILAIVLFGILFYMLQQHQLTGMLSRCFFKTSSKGIRQSCLRVVKVIVWDILLSAPLVIGGYYLLKKVAPLSFSDPLLHKYMILSGIVCILVLIFYLPFQYLMMKYLIEGDSHSWTVITKGYKDGLRHWGFSFAVIFLSSLIMVIAASIINMPQFIIHKAQFISQMGVMEGDPSGLPSYFGILVFVVSTIVTFMAQYVEMTLLFPIYYMYGSIETQKKEKADFENNIE